MRRWYRLLMLPVFSLPLYGMEGSVILKFKRKNNDKKDYLYLEYKDKADLDIGEYLSIKRGETWYVGKVVPPSSVPGEIKNTLEDLDTFYADEREE